MRLLPIILGIAALLHLSAPTATAQRATEELRRADSLVIGGDTAAAIKLLERVARRQPGRAELWHRLGLLAWRAAGSSQNAAMRGGITRIRYVRKADNALRLAARIAPDSGRYALDLGRFFLFNGIITVRLQAPGMFSRAHEAAERAGDLLLVSETTDQLGMLHWRRYQAVADRRPLKGDVALVPFDFFLSDSRTIPTFLESKTITLPTPAGEHDYRRATAFFQDALVANPANVAAARHALMALVERARWDELRAAAKRRLTVAPWDPWSWLALGMAEWRSGEVTGAESAFDSALVMLSPADRGYFTDLSRVLLPADSARYTALDARGRQVMDLLYWTAADPLELTRGNELRLEYLARVAEAELRWSSEDFALRGASTDRGQILIRYGPPPVVASFGPQGVATDVCPGFKVEFVPLEGQGRDTGVPDLSSCRSGNDPASGLILWYYPHDGLHFVFRAPPSFGVAHFTQDYADLAEQTRAAVPVRWRNVESAVGIDSLRTMLTRFRADGDSTDLLVHADLPLAQLAGEAAEQRDVLAGLVIRERTLRTLVRDTVLILQPADSLRPHSWVSRLPPGRVSYRVEALGSGSGNAARSSGSIAMEATSGFGISDMAVVRSARQPAGRRVERWRDLELEGGAGDITLGLPFALVWETYELARDSAGARYRIDITIQLREHATERPLLARIVDGVSGAVGIRQRDRSTVALSYERRASSAEVSVDYVTLDLPAAVPGSYSIVVEVTDLVGSRSTSTERIIVVR